MTPKQKRIALAEAAGWTWSDDETCWRDPTGVVRQRPLRPDPALAKENLIHTLPNYLNDADVMRRFLLSRDNFGFKIRYVAALRRIVLGNSRTWAEQRESFSGSAQFLLLTADAEQMADAALAAL